MRQHMLLIEVHRDVIQNSIVITRILRGTRMVGEVVLEAPAPAAAGSAVGMVPPARRVEPPGHGVKGNKWRFAQGFPSRAAPGGAPSARRRHDVRRHDSVACYRSNLLWTTAREIAVPAPGNRVRENQTGGNARLFWFGLNGYINFVKTARIALGFGSAGKRFHPNAIQRFSGVFIHDETLKQGRAIPDRPAILSRCN